MAMNVDAQELMNDDTLAVEMEPEESQRETRAKQGKSKGRSAQGKSVSKISTRNSPTGKTRSSKRTTVRTRGKGGPNKAVSKQSKPKSARRDIPNSGSKRT